MLSTFNIYDPKSLICFAFGGATFQNFWIRYCSPHRFRNEALATTYMASMHHIGAFAQTIRTFTLRGEGRRFEFRLNQT
jgi:hypothetical protein